MEHGLKVFNLSNIKVVFLPPNVTSKAQPLDQGIIAAYKAHFRRHLVQWVVDEANDPRNKDKMVKQLTPNIYQAMQWSLQAWKDGVTASTIKNCWRKSGILPASVLDPQPLAPQEPVVLEAGASGEDAASHAAGAHAAGSDDDVADEPVVCEDQLSADLPEDVSATEQLAAAIQELRIVAAERDLLPEGQDFVTAEEFLELEGEGEVHAELNDDELLAVVMSRGGDQPDSDEDEEDEPTGCKVTLQEAMACAEQLDSFAHSNPEFFSADQFFCLGNIRRALLKKQMAARQQKTLADLWGHHR